MNLSEHEQLLERWARAKKVAFSRDSQPSWIDLDKYIVWLKITTPDRKLWRDISKNPLTQEGIVKLKRDGWHIRSIGIIYEAGCDLQAKEITLGDMPGYQRDEAFFHEIYHAWYGKETSDNITGGLSLEELANNTIGHWLARQWRANPELLSQAITSFDLQPKIYDKVSYLAFSPYNNNFDLQLAFPFGEEIRQSLQQILF